MDAALRREDRAGAYVRILVSILVLVDAALRPDKGLMVSTRWFWVSLLVLVDAALRRAYPSPTPNWVSEFQSLF